MRLYLIEKVRPTSATQSVLRLEVNFVCSRWPKKDSVFLQNVEAMVILTEHQSGVKPDTWGSMGEQKMQPKYVRMCYKHGKYGRHLHKYQNADFFSP